MELKLKIFFSAIFLLGIPILILMMKFINNSLKKELEIRNPKVIEKAPWFFSKKKVTITNYTIVFGCITFVVLIWLDLVIIPID
jgi:quinol-cytochrome oxidoreductase complex cytochrome b subunit